MLLSKKLLKLRVMLPKNINSKVSLCLMVWNERKGCQVDVPKLPSESFLEVYAVDGGSTDGTVEYLEMQGIPVYRQPVRSLNAAYHYAVELCKGEALVVYFPKGNIDPACVLDIAYNLSKRIEFVVASRNILGAKNEEDNQMFKFRKWGVTILSAIASLLWRREGKMVKDVLHGVKGFSLSAFNKMAISKTGVTIDLEMTVRSYRFKIPRKEIPVVECKRINGESHFPIFRTARCLAEFLWEEIWRPSSMLCK